MTKNARPVSCHSLGTQRLDPTWACHLGAERQPRLLRGVPAAGPESKASLRQARRKGVLVAYDEELADRVRAVLLRGEAVTERQMFGGVAFMLGGHMFCGIVKDALMARLGPEAADRALDQPHVRPMDFTGRPMKGMVFIDPAGLQGDALRQWVDAAAGYARDLPP